MFRADGCLREVAVPVHGARGWTDAIACVRGLAATWAYLVDGVAAPLPQRFASAFVGDGHARVVEWTAGGVSFRAHLLNEDVFQFDFLPSGSPEEVGDVVRVLDALAERFGTEITVTHEHGDTASVEYPPRVRPPDAPSNSPAGGT